jgi:integrase
MAKAVLEDWQSKFPFRYPDHFVFPSERYQLQGPSKPLKFISADPTKPIDSFHSSWKTAKKLANVECRWHDCRHTFISMLGEVHTPDATIMAMAGHISRKMLERHSHSRNQAKNDAIIRAFGGDPAMVPAKVQKIR